VSPSTDTSPQPRRRADAERNIEAILDAALDALGSDLEASMGEIARRAGVARATLYVHFPTREVLIDAVTARGIAETTAAIEAAEPERGDPAEALGRVTAQAWQTMGRYHALVAINVRRPHAELHDRHVPVLNLLQPLIERGQASGAFRSDVPPAWHLSMILALIHAASAELRTGTLADPDLESALVETVVGAVSPLEF
jgi:AcrR family transcriptional regulator